jgi:hypothetical protein
MGGRPSSPLKFPVVVKTKDDVCEIDNTSPKKCDASHVKAFACAIAAVASNEGKMKRTSPPLPPHRRIVSPSLLLLLLLASSSHPEWKTEVEALSVVDVVGLVVQGRYRDGWRRRQRVANMNTLPPTTTLTSRRKTSMPPPLSKMSNDDDGGEEMGSSSSSPSQPRFDNPFVEFANNAKVAASEGFGTRARNVGKTMNVGDVVVPICGNTELRSDLAQLGLYAGVEYRICDIFENDGERRRKSSSHRDDAGIEGDGEEEGGRDDGGRIVTLRPAYPLRSHLERSDWPISIPSSSVPLWLSKSTYEAGTALGTLLLSGTYLLVAYALSTLGGGGRGWGGTGHVDRPSRAIHGRFHQGEAIPKARGGRAGR